MRDRREKGEIILDRRRASRIPVRFSVSGSAESFEFSAMAVNLTLKGVFVESEEPVGTLGTALELELQLPDQQAAAKVHGEIVRVARLSDEVVGFGVEFDPVDDATHDRISAVCGIAAKDMQST